MTRRIPLIPTLLVLLAAGYMVHLGLWQLDRLHQKESRIAQAQAAQKDSSLVSIGVVWREKQADVWDYRRTHFWCQQVMSTNMVSGRNAAGEAGWAQVVRCLTAPVMTQTFRPTQGAQGVLADVVIGWSKQPKPVAWQGGEVLGRIAPGGEFRHHVVADPPLGGMVANAQPDPRTLPNNHLSYAVQWFLFAITALVIYGLALWRRGKGA